MLLNQRFSIYKWIKIHFYVSNNKDLRKNIFEMKRNAYKYKIQDGILEIRTRL